MLTACVRRLRRTRAGGDAGVTLMELVVSMTLMTIIGSMAMTFFVGMNTATSKTTSVNQSTAGARTVLDSWTALLRVADSTVAPGSAAGRVLMVTPTEITFYADVNNRTCSSTCTAVSNPTKVDLSLAGGQLVEKRYTYSGGAYPSTPTTTDVLASGASASGWLFTPYVNGNPPTFTAQNLCPGGSLGLCTGTTGADAVLDTIVRVDIAFSIQPTSSDAPQSFAASAALPAAIS